VKIYRRPSPLSAQGRRDGIPQSDETIDGHPYCAACIAATVPTQTRYLPGQDDKRAATTGGTDWGDSLGR